MKKKGTSAISILMCIILVASVFTACSVKKNDNDKPTAQNTELSWYQDYENVYVPVTISSVELADLVQEALGKDTVPGFNGDLNTLTEEQRQKVEQLAADKGLIVEKDNSGNTVIKKEEVATTQASPSDVSNILSQAGVSNTSKLSNEEYNKLSSAAAENGMTVQSSPDSSTVAIVRPVTTQVTKYVTVPVTQAPTSPNTPTSGGNVTSQTGGTPATQPTFPTTTKKITIANPTGSYETVPRVTGNNVPQTTLVKTRYAQNTWRTTAGGSKNDVFGSCAATKDGGVVSVGTSYSYAGVTSKGVSVPINSGAGYIAMHDEKGKLLWSDVLGADETTYFEDVAVLTDGSIAVVGQTLAEKLVPADKYIAKGTVESIVVRYSPKGERLSLNVLGGSGADMLTSIAATSDGGYVVGGTTKSNDGPFFSGLGNGASNGVLFRFNSADQIIWKMSQSSTKANTFNGISVSPTGDIYASCICAANDGDFADFASQVAVGKKYTVIYKLDANGKIIWRQPISDVGAVEMPCVQATDDGGVVVAGYYSAGQKANEYFFKDFYNGGVAGTNDAVVVKFFGSGKTSWITPLVGFNGDFCTGICKVPGGYAVCGRSNSTNRDFANNPDTKYNGFIYVLSEYGTKQTYSTFGGSSSDSPRAICSNGGKTVYICGSTNSADGVFADCPVKGSDESAACFVVRYDLNQ